MTFHGATATRLHALEQTTVQVEGVVTDRRGTGGNMTSYTLSLSAVDGEETSGTALLTCHYVSDLQPGFAVVLEATVIPLAEAAGDGYDATALRGDGYIVGLLSESEESVTITHENSTILSVRAGKLRRALSARLELVTGAGAQGIPAALLLGDQSNLSDEIRRDFARTGVSHLLAISGLHMTLLFGLLALFLQLIRVHKRARAVLLGISTLAYLLLLGFPPSATRAVIMLGVTYLSHLLSERADPLTSLGLAGAVILAITPYAVADAGFWMSFLATLGLVTLMPLLSRWLSTEGAKEPLLLRTVLRGLVKLATAILVGIVAVSFTLFVVAVVIGEASILSPVATLLLTPFCAVILLLSLGCIPFMNTALGVLLGGVIEQVCALMTDLTAWLARPSWVVVSLRHPAVVPLAAVMTAVLLLLLVVRLPSRRQWTVVLPLFVGWIAIGSVLGIHHLITQDEVDVTYLQPSTQSDALVLVSGNEGFVCDLSNGSLSSMTAAAREAKRQGATELSVFMLTHYHTRTSGALVSLLARETVRALWLPVPADEEDYYLLLACLEKAEAAGVPVYMYAPGETLRVFEQGSLTLETASLGRSVQPVLLVSLDVSDGDTGKDRLVYCGSAVFESDLADVAAELISSADAVIFGSHGPLFKAPYGEGLDLNRPREIIFSAYGDTAAWFAPAGLPEGTSMWLGQKRLILYQSSTN
jgi:competence protein ComEC